MIFAIAALLIAGPPQPPRPPDGTYTYQTLVNGTIVQSDTVTIGSSSGGVVVRDAASIPARSITAIATSTYDPASLAQTAYTADFTLPSGMQHTDTTFAPGVVTVRVPGQTVALKADPSAPLEVVADNLAGTDVMIAAMLHATGARAFTLAVLSGGVTVVCHVSPAHAARPAGVPGGATAVTISSGQLTEVYWFDPTTFTVDAISIPSQSALIRLSR